MASNSQVMKLYNKLLHEIDKERVGSTSVKLQGTFWVPAAIRLIKT